MYLNEILYYITSRVNLVNRKRKFLRKSKSTAYIFLFFQNKDFDKNSTNNRYLRILVNLYFSDKSASACVRLYIKEKIVCIEII